MAYNGSMLVLRDSSVASSSTFFGVQEFIYQTSDAIGVVNGAGYFSDGMKRGMKQGDIVWVQVNSSGTLTPHLCYVSAAPYTASGYDATTSFVTTGS